MDHGAHGRARHGGVPECRDREGRFHPIIDRVADDPVGAGILDRAQVELALGGRVLRDVGEPQLVRMSRGELPAHEVVVDRRARSLASPTVAVQHRGDAVLAAQARHAVLARVDPAFGSELVGDEAVAEDRVIGMDLTGSIDEVRVGPVPVSHRVGPPPVEALRREAEHPAGHHDGDPV